MNAWLRKAVLGTARQTLGRLPRSRARLTGPLAVNGGKPVRDQRLRPWPSGHDATLREWVLQVEPAFRRIFLAGVEGLPQTRQRAFAERWAAYCQCRHALLLPHGTDALRIALAAVLDHDGLDYGGEVIVPNLSFIASATAPLDRRFGIVLVDVERGTLNLDPRRVEEAIVPGKTRAILPVHQFGQPADMTALTALARKHQLVVIEDAAQAHGAEWESGPVGSLGEAAAFSFQSAKNLSSGEGGILTTNDTGVFKRAHAIHNAGRAPELGARWEHPSLGWNIRPTEYQAALLMHRFARFPAQQAERAVNFQALRALLAGAKSVRPLDTHPSVRKHGMYMFVMRYQAEACGGLPIDAFVDAVKAEGVPMHRGYAATIAQQPVMQALMQRRPEYVRAMPTPVADQAATEIVYIAGSTFLGTEADMADIAAAIRKVEHHRA
ncbi:MAG: DegT/DnrJ/EryC1/StrS family aminotransferase [Vicinamibacterales bacterium]|jgi:dTDP-4-amino-4,6-dideoxygalactose transaminase